MTDTWTGALVLSATERREVDSPTASGAASAADDKSPRRGSAVVLITTLVFLARVAVVAIVAIDARMFETASSK